MPPLRFSNNDLLAALTGFEFERDRIIARIAEIQRLLEGGRPEPAPSSGTRKPRKKRSAAVRRKMALAQRARYARLKQGAQTPQASPAKKKRKLSAAGKRNIIEGTKRRWAAVRAAKQAAAQKSASSKGSGTAVKNAVASHARKAAKAPRQAEAPAAAQ